MELLTIIFSILLFSVGYSTGIVLGFFVGVLYGKYYFDQSEKTGHRRWEFFRKLFIWNFFHRYFSINYIFHEHSDEEIKKLKNSIIAIHPHGLATASSILGFGLLGNRRHILDKVYITASNIVFSIPVWRDSAVWRGAVKVDKNVISDLLDQENHVIILPGGIREVMVAKRGLLEIYTKHRGFIRMAKEKNVPLIPVFAQGESEIFKILDIFPKVREFLVNIILYPYPTLFLGPYPAKLNIIIGKAIYPDQYNTVDELYNAFYIEFAKLVEYYDNGIKYGKQMEQWIEKMNNM